jgi:Cof subfamily protein (haloacid dehalogenase superfamily)
MSNIRLVIADVDGTLVTPENQLTERARRAIFALRTAGIAFAITSGRPPRGMSMLVDPLELTAPIAAFDGGMLVHPDLSLIEEHTLPIAIIDPIIRATERHKLDVWLYRGGDWFIRALSAPHVEREKRTVRFSPTVVASFDDLHERIIKIVGVSDDLEAVARCETDLRRQFGEGVSAARSQPYYLDVTHALANKGAVVRRLSELLRVPVQQIATIGDMPSDVLMFAQSGLSIAMGNASLEVRSAARWVTGSNAEDGFADAVDKYILAGSAQPRAPT